MASRGATDRGDKVASAQSQRRIATPIVLQMHATECGAACLGAVLGFFGRWVPLTELRERCEVSRDGSSAASIARAARHYGLECNGLSVRAEQLKKLELPLILFWQFSHFVVLDGFDKDSFAINDPSSGRRRIPEEEFRKAYSGIALRLAKGDDFQPGGEPPGLVAQLRAVLSGCWGAFGGVLACGFLVALLALVIPASLVVVVDGVLQSQGPPEGLLAALLASAALVYIVSAIKHRLVKRLGVRIAVIGANDAVTRLLRLPVEFFDHRMVGDLTDRVSSIDRVSKNITERFLLLALDMVMAAVLLVAMLALDAVLTAVVLLLAALHGLAARPLALHRSALSDAMRREQGLLLGTGLQMLSHADTLRMTGADDRFFARWSGQQAKELRARRPHAELSAYHAAVPGLIAIFRSAAVLGVGASMVAAGELSLGMLVGFYVLAELFLAPVGRFLELTGERQALKTDLYRQGDITAAAEDPAIKRRRPESKSIPTFNDRLQLTGALELRNVTFGFNKSRPPLIKDFSLVIEPGQRVAVVGPSGSGKSTLARLVAGVHQPWSGEILFDGQPREEIPEEVLRRSISMVEQDIALFSASLRDNITLWNAAIPDEAVFAATRDACIHDEILVRPDGYATRVEEGGANFSGGQRQRLEIARALVGDPTMLLLDEATSSLDAATEEDIDGALRRRGMTCLIVAHRLSTVRDCDNIIVLERGVEVQRGTHDQLVQDKGGRYFGLVRSDHALAG